MNQVGPINYPDVVRSPLAWTRVGCKNSLKNLHMTICPIDLGALIDVSPMDGAEPPLINNEKIGDVRCAPSLGITSIFLIFKPICMIFTLLMLNIVNTCNVTT